jgi:hypothetical protein
MMFTNFLIPSEYLLVNVTKLKILIGDFSGLSGGYNHKGSHKWKGEAKRRIREGNVIGKQRTESSSYWLWHWKGPWAKKSNNLLTAGKMQGNGFSPSTLKNNSTAKIFILASWDLFWISALYNSIKINWHYLILSLKILLLLCLWWFVIVQQKEANTIKVTRSSIYL